LYLQAAFWAELADSLGVAIAHLGIEKTRAWASYWSGHQRFFKQVRRRRIRNALNKLIWLLPTN